MEHKGEHPDSWSWRNYPLGAMEHCPCGCPLTVGEATTLGLIPIGQANHSTSAIMYARQKLIQATDHSNLSWRIG